MDVGVERHRHARGLAAAALDRRPAAAPGRRHARRAPGRRGATCSPSPPRSRPPRPGTTGDHPDGDAHRRTWPPTTCAQVRDLMDAAFDDFTDHDWSHALGGLHAVVHARAAGSSPTASLVQRRLLVGGVDGRSLRCGYVEAVAVDPDRCQGTRPRRAGDGRARGPRPGYDVLALSASERAAGSTRPAAGSSGAGRRRSWRRPAGRPPPRRTARSTCSAAPTLDLDAAIACDWRDGDVW